MISYPTVGLSIARRAVVCEQPNCQRFSRGRCRSRHPDPAVGMVFIVRTQTVIAVLGHAAGTPYGWSRSFGAKERCKPLLAYLGSCGVVLYANPAALHSTIGHPPRRGRVRADWRGRTKGSFAHAHSLLCRLANRQTRAGWPKISKLGLSCTRALHCWAAGLRPDAGSSLQTEHRAI
jgi:hypothetical protein